MAHDALLTLDVPLASVIGYLAPAAQDRPFRTHWTLPVQHSGTCMDDKSAINLEEVIEKYQNLIAEHPHTPEYHKELGNAFHRSGAFDLALEEFRTCLHIDPNYFPAQYNMGNCYFAMNKYHQ